MAKRITQFFLICLCLLTAAACKEDTPSTPQSAQLAITCTYPTGIDNGTLSNVKITFENVNTQQQTVVTNASVDGLLLNTKIATGHYNIALEADLTYTYKGNEYTIKALAYKESVTIRPDSKSLELNLFTNDEINPEEPTEPDTKTGFVIAEIFCAGTKTPQGTNYFSDTYFRIYNNTDHVLYADSLALLGTWFNTGTKNQDLNPDIMNEAITVQALYIVPGTGKDHPVQPGGSLLIANNALNHQYANPNSFDMTKADFEWYDESTNPNITDVDNPDVPNLDRYMAMSNTVWDPNTQGLNAYAIAKMNVDKNTYLKDYHYSYTYTIVPGDGSEPFTTSGDCYKLPNEWVIDAVNMGVNGSMQWLVTSPELDRGWTYCSRFLFDDSRYGKSVRRKVASRAEDGRAILMDTNNSTDDFEPRVDADPYHVF